MNSSDNSEPLDENGRPIKGVRRHSRTLAQSSLWQGHSM
jgi:hypothetical protein